MYQATSAHVRGKKVGQGGELQRKEADTSTREEDPNEKHIEDPSQMYDGQSAQVNEQKVCFISTIYYSGYMNHVSCLVLTNMWDMVSSSYYFFLGRVYSWEGGGEEYFYYFCIDSLAEPILSWGFL